MTETIPVEVMIVDDDASLLTALKTALASEYPVVRCCNSVSEAKTVLADWTPGLLITDVILPDGNAIDILSALREDQPYPMIVAISGAATPMNSFTLAKYGVHEYLEKPFGLTELHQAINDACSASTDLRPHIRTLVGRRPIKEVEDEVRHTMVTEAMVQSKGSRRAAAKVLDISRQLLQHILRK